MIEVINLIGLYLVYPTILFYTLKSADWVNISLKIDRHLSNYKIIRRLLSSKKAWVKFDGGYWVRCSWADKEKGYLTHPLDGGMFHVTLKNIIEIEDYSKGE